MEILGSARHRRMPRIGKMIEQYGELFLRGLQAREVRYCQSRKHAIEHSRPVAARRRFSRPWAPAGAGESPGPTSRCESASPDSRMS